MSNSVFELIKSHIGNPINLIDVGAAGGVIEGWGSFGDKANVFCFEARHEDARNLSERNDLTNVRYFPLALSSDESGFDLTVTENPGCSSAYPPIERFYHRYPANSILRPLAKVHVPSTTVDAFMRKEGVSSLQGMKLDTQGSELDILRGAEYALKSCLFLNIEAEFNAMYEGQPLFCDLDRFLRDRGFVLWRFNNLAHYATGRIGGEQNQMIIGSEPGGQRWVNVPHGQLFWGDALYVRKSATAICSDNLSADDALAGAALVSQWRYFDLALEMLRKGDQHGLAEEVETLLESRFVSAAPSHYGPDQFQSVTVSRTDVGWPIDFEATNLCQVCGPYVRLPRGEHLVTFYVDTQGLEAALLSRIRFDVALDFNTINAVDLNGSAGAELLRTGKITVPFFNNSSNSVFEFRIFSWGKPFDGIMTFKGAEVIFNIMQD